MEIIFICLVIIAFLACLLTSKKDGAKAYTRLIRIFYMINTFCLLTSCLMHYNESLPYGAGLDDGPLRWLFFLLMWPFLFNWLLRLVFFPYIYSGILTVLYIKDLKQNQFPKKETILFILLLLLSILGLVCLEVVSQDMWRTLSSV